MTSDLKRNKSFFLYSDSERKATEHQDPLFSGTEGLSKKKDMEKTKALNGFAVFVYNGKACVPGGII